jgi:UDP-N-acetylglucosamine acyltransferase
MAIHPTAVVDPQAMIHESAEIGPYVVIEGKVTIGADTVVSSHAHLSGPTVIGARNRIGSFTSVGAPPQDIHYAGEPTELIIGDDNLIHRGTVAGKGKTVVGNGNMLMAYTHVAHDCVIGNQAIMANVATLAGHVEIGDHVNLGGLVAVHQFCRIGAHTYVGGLSGISLDVPPFVIIAGTRNRMRISGINKIGMRRSGMSRESIGKLEEAFRIIFRSPQLLLNDALVKVKEDIPDCPEVDLLVDFFQTSKRGVVKRTLEDEG